MRDEHRQQLVEQYEEAAISLLMDEYAESEGARLLHEYETAAQNGELPEIPAELDEKCRKLIERSFASQERKSRIIRIRKAFVKAAVVVFALLGLSTVTVLSVDALRIPVINFLADQSGQYSAVIFDGTADVGAATTDSTVLQFENNLPEGYRVVQNTFNGISGMVYCVNEDNQVVYLEVMQTEWGLNIDTEDIAYADVDFGEFTAVFQDKDGYSLVWLDDRIQTAYTLFTNGLDSNIFWKLAYAIVE